MPLVNFHLNTLQNCKCNVIVVVVVVVVQEFKVDEEEECINTALELVSSVLKPVTEVRHGSS